MLLPEEVPLWFAVRVLPRHEYKVSSLLRIKGQEEFLPIVPRRQQWSDRVKIMDRPLFPGYIFCRTKRSEFGSVLKTSGVHCIVSFGGKPHPMSEDEISSLRQVIASGRDLQSMPYFAVGQTVAIIRGPLAGVVGTVMQYKNRHRLILSIQLLMRSVSVDVAMEELTPSISHTERHQP